MPSCPHCRELYFGNPDQCPKCSYDFKLKRVISKDEQYNLQVQRTREREQARIDAEKQRNREEELSRIHAAQATENRLRAFENSGRYEYATEYLSDSYSGILDKKILDATLQKYATQGWKLHSVITNEAGKNASSISFGGVTSGTNSTMDVTILIFERCIKLPGQ